MVASPTSSAESLLLRECSVTGTPTAQQSDRPAESVRRHVLTVGLEDWFQVGAFQQLIRPEQWYRFETRLERSTRATLDLLDHYGVKATFFVLGWVAQELPELVAEVASHGHEIASRGFYHRGIRELDREEFRDDLLRTQDALEAAARCRVQGYRLADGWLRPQDLWALDVLAEEGYAYDSSILPSGLRFHAEPWRRFAHVYQTPAGILHELPPSCIRVAGCNLPVCGGNWFRQIPHTVLKHLIRRWDQQCDSPLVTYFHVWELDPDQPRISAVDRWNRLRHYRNLDKMRWVLAEHLSRFRFGPAADYLALKRQEPVTPDPASPDSDECALAGPSRVGRIPGPVEFTGETEVREADASGPLTAVSIVIPCFNEESTLPYLARTLEHLEFRLRGAGYEPVFVFVDDCSTDATWDTLQAMFETRSNVRLLRHERNGGVSAAIQTGLQQADTDIVCSMDCDCSYDPLTFAEMIPLLKGDVDLVTASPYHPDGQVRNVPGWRLLLSKGLSRLYQLILPQKLYTWTSCFRVYRKSAVVDLPLSEGGFLGTAELVGRLSQAGGTIVEYPATLEVRIFGESKMKTCRTILGHLRLIARLVCRKYPKRSRS